MVILEHVCYHKWTKGGGMRLLKLAVEIQRWDLAAHTIVLATARVLKNGDRPHVSRIEGKKKPRGQGKRS
jgi:hypothetical protein